MTPVPYAILPRLDATARAIAFTSLAALATHVHRARGGQGLDLVEIDGLHQKWRRECGGAGVDLPEGVADRGVQIWTTDLQGGHDRCIGWAWLSGGGLDRLRAAIQRAEAAPARKSTTSGPSSLMADDSPLRTRLYRRAVLGLDAGATR